MSADLPLVVVLGASGFIGSPVTRALAKRPIRLRLVARRPTPVPEGGVADIEVRTADLTEEGALADLVEGADAVFHLVAYTDGGWRVADGDTMAERINVGLARELVEAIRSRPSPGKPPVVLYAGTKTQVGHPPGDRIDGTEPDNPVSPYGRQKLAAETALKEATAEGVLRAVSLRLPTVYGHGPESTATDRGVAATMMRRAMAGDRLTMWSDGSVRRDLVYIDDVVDAFLTALDHADELAGRHWLVGGGASVPLGELFTEIAALVAERTGRPPVPVVSVPPPDNADPTDMSNQEMDSTAFRNITGWRPKTLLRDGLARTATELVGA
ncbi:NAD-dependent epimerase/dehydratase [Spongiactinospora sp. TRM90649]|uniref:NAD-dependent epimerase/dehydratase family protein n=1 Tax=Spongiactinospora sp. TRM90649 TaxID=3031114 RepID=UPI0023F98604|nr:NAD-dependent epimerase/dehydratase [Spongiactinospora sp. TRM90649]MDF5759271.1 NAD-dependent epimerase/dehydratase [Spongiactinospora sp. TRM90649]